MHTRPILFSGPMIRALLAGRKTQTRRILNPQPKRIRKWDWKIGYDQVDEMWVQGVYDMFAHRLLIARRWRCPYGKTGDKLWVRETWAPEPGFEYKEEIPRYEGGGIDRIVYRADETDGRGEPDGIGLNHGVKKWRPSIYMPRWGSRITLAVTRICVERLHDITEADARAEGMPPAWLDESGKRVNAQNPPTFRQGFARGWDEINRKRAPWKSNPWLWVVNFDIDEADEIDDYEPQPVCL